MSQMSGIYFPPFQLWQFSEAEITLRDSTHTIIHKTSLPLWLSGQWDFLRCRLHWLVFACAVPKCNYREIRPHNMRTKTHVQSDDKIKIWQCSLRKFWHSILALSFNFLTTYATSVALCCSFFSLSSCIYDKICCPNPWHFLTKMLPNIYPMYMSAD